MQIYIARNGERLGPFPIDEINRQLAAGTISATDQAWYEGAAAWAPLSTLPGVSMPGATGVVAAAGLGNAPIVAGRTEPLAIWSLVLGILGFCCIPSALVAVILGHMAVSKIGKNANLGGRGLALTGLILGYIAFVGGIIWLFFMGGMAMIEELQNR